MNNIIKKMFTVTGVQSLLEALDKISHENEEKDETIHELQTLLKFRTNENKSLYKEIDRLRKVIEIKDADRIELCKQVERYAKDIDIANNDYKKCYAENVRLAEENNQLKLRNKMLTKIGFNSIFGLNCGKNHWVYTDTDSIKAESEENKHDDNN